MHMNKCVKWCDDMAEWLDEMADQERVSQAEYENWKVANNMKEEGEI